MKYKSFLNLKVMMDFDKTLMIVVICKLAHCQLQMTRAYEFMFK